ncbi:MAG: transglycosylase SLT domain-containing protein [Pseudomonadota bacterium]
MMRPLKNPVCVTLIFLLANGTSAIAQDRVSIAKTVEIEGQKENGSEKAALRRFLEATIAENSGFDDRFAAEVWLVDMSTRLASFVPDIDARLTLLRQIHAAAARSGLPAELVLAVIEVESTFDRFAVSRAGAQGLMQVMPFWREEIGRPGDNLTDNETNLSYGCRILQFYLQRENGALHRALAAYNGSSGSRRYSNKVQAAWKARWKNDPLEWEP